MCYEQLLRLSEQIEHSTILEVYQQCEYCRYLWLIQHIILSHPKKCIYCKNSKDVLNKTEHLLKIHPERCIYCSEYSLEYPSQAQQHEHMIHFHNEILTYICSLIPWAEE